MDESDWVSVHAFYHGDLDELLTRAVAPLVEELTERKAVRAWFFLRYWERGPHVRLRLAPATGRREEVETESRDRLGGYLDAHPSSDRMGAEAYAGLARALARTERLDDYADELHPNNQVAFIPYRREHQRYGHGAAMEAVERHFVASSRIALRVMTLNASGDQRATAACAAMLLTWLAWDRDPVRLSRVIGTGGAERNGPDMLGLDGSLGAAADERRRTRGLELARQMHHLATAADQGRAAGSGTLVDWLRSVDDLRRDLQGTNSLPTLEICAHLFCNRLGLTLDAEQSLRRIAATALAGLAGLAGLAAQQTRHPGSGAIRAEGRS